MISGFVNALGLSACRQSVVRNPSNYSALSLPLAIVGLLESLLTAALVDELTDTGSSKNREIRGQGLANLVTGFCGGMAGCGMVGQSIINVRSGGRSRLSTAVSGAFLLFSIFGVA